MDTRKGPYKLSGPGRKMISGVVQEETVLIVDDDDLYVEDIAMLLRDKYRLIHIRSLKRLCETIKADKPSVILSDVFLGDEESGLELFSKLEGMGDVPPVIMMSDRPSVKVIVEAMNRGAVTFMPKSAGVDELISILEQVLEDKRVG